MQACFERAPDRQPWMAAEARTDALGFDHGGEQRGPFAAGDLALARPGLAQARQRIGQRLAGIARPQRLGRGDLLGGSDGRVQQRIRRGALRHHRGKLCGRRVRAARPDRARPCGLPDGRTAAASTRARRTPKPDAGFKPRRTLRSRRRAASSRAARSPPSVHSGCFSSPSSATGAKPRSTAVTSASSSVAGGVSPSGVPAESSISIPHRRSSAVTRVGKVAVGRDQGGGVALVFQCAAQRQGDDQRLLVRRRAIARGHMLERRGRRARPGIRWFRPAASARRPAGGAPSRCCCPASRRRRGVPGPAPSAARAGRTVDAIRRAPPAQLVDVAGRGRAARACPGEARR